MAEKSLAVGDHLFADQDRFAGEPGLPVGRCEVLPGGEGTEAVVAQQPFGIGGETLPMGERGLVEARVAQTGTCGEQHRVRIGVPEQVASVVREGVGIGAQDSGQMGCGVLVLVLPELHEGVGNSVDGRRRLAHSDALPDGAGSQGVQTYRARVVLCLAREQGVLVEHADGGECAVGGDRCRCGGAG